MPRIVHALRFPVLAAALLALLAGCYLPVRFDMEITLDRFGYYDIEFDGYVAEMELYQDLRKGGVALHDENERVFKVRSDLTREEATESAQYMGRGIFHLKWRRRSDLIRYKSVSFLRRNNAFLTLTYEKDKRRIVMEGSALGDKQAAGLVEAGLGLEGQIRFFTHAEVIEHNATRVADGKERGKVYIWDIRGYATKSSGIPRPRLVVGM